VEVDRLLQERSGCDELDQHTLELTYAAGHRLDEPVETGGRQVDPAVGGLASQDVAPHGRIRRLELGHEAAAELSANAFAQLVEVLGRAVTGQDDASAGVDHVLHRVEELELRRGLALQELNVVDDEQTAALAEALLELTRALAPQCSHELVREALGGDVADVAAAQAIALHGNGTRQMGLAHPRSRMEVELVQRSLPIAGNRQ